MTKVVCSILKCHYNDGGVCGLDKIKVSKLGCVNVKTY